MTVTLEAVMFTASDPVRAAGFWGAVLGRESVQDERGVLLPGDARQVGLRFVEGPDSPPDVRDDVHLHLSGGVRDQREWIAACEQLGGRLRGNGRFPDDSYAAMADTTDHDFCVIEDGNRFLAGCGPLGEVTCEGTRAVGRFWSAVLRWPLVWDQNGETAIQAPAGGTKLAWSGDEPTPGLRGDRPYLSLVVAREEWDGQVERILGLGASLREGVTGGEDVVLDDPDGIPFVLRKVTTRS